MLGEIVVGMNNIIRHIIFILIILAYTKCFCMAGENSETNTNKEKEDSRSLINVNTTVDKAKITIGDKITYKIIVDFPDEINVMPPEIKDKIGDFTAVDSGIEELKKEDGRIRQERWL